MSRVKTRKLEQLMRVPTVGQQLTRDRSTMRYSRGEEISDEPPSPRLFSPRKIEIHENRKFRCCKVGITNASEFYRSALRARADYPVGGGLKVSGGRLRFAITRDPPRPSRS